MFDIQQEIDDSFSRTGKSHLSLNADGKLDPYHISYPILWTGYLNNQAIIVRQADSSTLESAYKFVGILDDNRQVQLSVIRIIKEKIDRACN